MGVKKRTSSDRIRLRATLPPAHRDTLLPCPACGGQGQQKLEDAGSYRFKQCAWCDGTGTVEAQIVKMFRRWLRIYAWNYASGHCRAAVKRV